MVEPKGEANCRRERRSPILSRTDRPDLRSFMLPVIPIS